MSEIILSERYVTETCCNCGVSFAMTKGFHDVALREKKNKTFYCPAGHPQHYTGESDAAKAERLARELAASREREAAEREARNREWRLRRQAEGKTRAIKKRVANGVCPCCQRTFENLARHMKTKHPAFTEKETTA